MKIVDKLSHRVGDVQSLLCVGLDPHVDLLPKSFLEEEYPCFEFNKWIIDQTHEFVCAYKPNLAFYEARGVVGYRELELTMEYLHENFSDIVTIADAKLGDIGSTSEAYAKAIFDVLGFDAVTLSPYVGGNALKPFLDREDKASIILCRTSDSGSGEFQDLIFGEKPLWQVVAEAVSQNWNQLNNCMVVVGATEPEILGQVRKVVGEMPILVPGVGAQGGKIDQVLSRGLNKANQGLIINVGRQVIYSSIPRRTMDELKNEVNACFK